MAQQLQLEVITPERRVLAVCRHGDRTRTWGELGILPGHNRTNFPTQTGVLSYVQEEKPQQIRPKRAIERFFPLAHKRARRSEVGKLVRYGRENTQFSPKSGYGHHGDRLGEHAAVQE